MNFVNKLDSNKRLLYFFFIRKKVMINNLLNSNNNNQYLFILSPPFSGSTLLNERISTTKNISCNNNIGLREGQHLPKVKDILFTNDRWDPEKVINWRKVHNLWDKYWEKSKSVLLEKSPPNICRATQIEKEFKNSKFICLIRNPYAQIEGHMRRYSSSPENATLLCLNYFRYQKENIEKLQKCILIKYEELADNTLETKNIISEFIPELKDINTNKKFTAHNLRNKGGMRIVNLNNEKISNLKKEDIKSINNILRKDLKLLNYFNYSLV